MAAVCLLDDVKQHDKTVLRLKLCEVFYFERVPVSSWRPFVGRGLQGEQMESIQLDEWSPSGRSRRSFRRDGSFLLRCSGGRGYLAAENNVEKVLMNPLEQNGGVSRTHIVLSQLSAR